jgi:ParB family chromosome partitioning protein
MAGEKHQKVATDRVLREGLNVRQTESLVSQLIARESSTNSKTPPNSQPKDPHVTHIENQLRERLGTKIHLRYSQGKGALEISFFSDADLERVLQLLGINTD